ncbi:MAG: hypothetical protein ACTSRW_06120 [Candidatus Helarchaeota archaeon]
MSQSTSQMPDTYRVGENISLKNSIIYLIIVISLTIILFLLLDNFTMLFITALGAKFILDLMGIQTVLYFNYVALYSPSNIMIINGPLYPTGFQIINICTGIEALSLITAMVIATPPHSSKKQWLLKGIALIFFYPALIFANFFRIVTTVLMSIAGFSIFVSHEVVAAAFSVLFIIIFILIINSFIVKNFIDAIIDVAVGIYRPIQRIFNKSSREKADSAENRVN